MLYILRIRIFQRGRISGSRTVDHKILSTYTLQNVNIFMSRKIPVNLFRSLAFGIEGLSNLRSTTLS